MDDGALRLGARPSTFPALNALQPRRVQKRQSLIMRQPPTKIGGCRGPSRQIFALLDALVRQDYASDLGRGTPSQVLQMVPCIRSPALAGAGPAQLHRLSREYGSFGNPQHRVCLADEIQKLRSMRSLSYKSTWLYRQFGHQCSGKAVKQRFDFGLRSCVHFASILLSRASQGPRQVEKHLPACDRGVQSASG